MSREIKLGAFAFVVLVLSIWGYTFLKGKNLLKKSYIFETVYNDVTQLERSSPVYINGYKVGKVQAIDLNPKNMQEMIITFDVENDFKIPKNAKAVLASEGVMGGKAIQISFDRQCTGPDCAENYDRLQGTTQGFLQSLVGTDDVKEYASAFGGELEGVLENLGTPEGQGAINQSVLDLQKTMENMSRITATTDLMMAQSSKNLRKTIENMSIITDNLAQNNAQITAMLNNLNTVSQQIKDANIGNTIATTTGTIDEAKVAIGQLQGTLTNADTAIKSLSSLMTQANSGDGTLAKLINDKELYTNLEMTTKNLSLLLQDLRLNPSRYVKVSVFGKKNKDKYTLPEEDPAFKKN